MGASASRPSLITWEGRGPACSHCGAVFTLLFRRHHCRACGHTVCSTCSPYTEYLPQFGFHADVPQRVCTRCAIRSVNTSALERDAFAFVDISDGVAVDLDTLDQATGTLIDIQSDAAFNAHLMNHFTTCFRSAFAQAAGQVIIKYEEHVRLYNIWKRAHPHVELSAVSEPPAPPTEPPPSARRAKQNRSPMRSGKSAEPRHVTFAHEDDEEKPAPQPDTVPGPSDTTTKLVVPVI
ncbi:unnamed protein product (mitochondrion) [Plasmodiophora brassicae]|uniref:FYVE-type domain-containing protein n=1 Tax=Plasmodiophora brassicae TaxID=37360 RepID=A0A3P3YDK0_PLABS|nr:unnamed protein product [Plasmodiophora brassicae]